MDLILDPKNDERRTLNRRKQFNYEDSLFCLGNFLGTILGLCK